MELQISDEVLSMIQNFRLPRYREIPNVGLYLDQVSKFINEYLDQLPMDNITNSMISNYVKHKLITNPIKKQYDRQQIAQIIFIAFTKNAISLENAGKMLNQTMNCYSLEVAYNYFVEEFENHLRSVFGLEILNKKVEVQSDLQKLVQNILICLAYQQYVDLVFETI